MSVVCFEGIRTSVLIALFITKRRLACTASCDSYAVYVLYSIVYILYSTPLGDGVQCCPVVPCGAAGAGKDVTFTSLHSCLLIDSIGVYVLSVVIQYVQSRNADEHRVCGSVETTCLGLFHISRRRSAAGE